MFDSIMVECPSCKQLQELQSKVGACELKEYTLLDVPANILMDLEDCSPHICEDCEEKYDVEAEIVSVGSIRPHEEYPHTEDVDDDNSY